MPLRQVTRRFPRVSRKGARRIELRIGGVTMTRDVRENLGPNILSEEDAIVEYARRWCIRNGLTWDQLLDDPAKLAEFHAENAQIRIDD